MTKSCNIAFLIFISLFLVELRAVCQNLIPNGDFEDYTNCPNNVSQLSYADLWYTPTWSTPDYYNSCDEVPVPALTYTPVFAQSGNGFIGLFAEDYQYQAPSNYKEYATCRLSSTLVSGYNYILSFWMRSNLDGRAYSSASLPVGERGFFGFCFSEVAPDIINTQSTTAPYNTSIVDSFGVGRIFIPASDSVYTSLSWKKVILNYNAIGNENYLTLGQFREGSTSLIAPFPSSQGFDYGSYFFIDNISLEESVITTAVFDNKFDISFELYPNPSSGKIWIRTKQNIVNAAIEIRDISNSLIYSEKIILNKHESLLNVNLAKGIYSLKIRDINSQQCNFKKIVIQE